MSVTRATARTRVRYLYGAHLTLGGLTDAQLDEILHEATLAWSVHSPGYPVTASTNGASAWDIAAAEKRVRIGLVNSGYGNVYVREFLTIHGGSAITAKALDRIPVHEIVALQNNVGATGTPTMVATELSGGTSVGNMQQEWNLYFYPIPSGTFTFQFQALIFPYKLTGDTNTMKWPDDEAYAICRVAAAIAAEITGRSPALIEELWRPIAAVVRDFAATRLLTMNKGAAA